MLTLTFLVAVLALVLAITSKVHVDALEAEKAIKDPNDELVANRIAELNKKYVTLLNIVAELENKVTAFEKGNTIIHVPVKVVKKSKKS